MSENRIILIIFITTLLNVFRTFSQQDIVLSGVVVEQNSKFKNGSVSYLSNVIIKSNGIAPQLTDVNGKFNLIVVDKPIGKIIEIVAAKKGYEVVNKQELKEVLVLGRSSPLKIVMAKAERLYENQLRYYEIAESATVKSYKKKLDILKRYGEERNALIKKLELEHNKKISSIEEANKILNDQLEEAKLRAKDLAKKFLLINLDDNSELYQRAFKAFLRYDIDLALSIMRGVNLKERISVNSKEKIKDKKRLLNRDKQIKQDLEQSIFVARLHSLKNDVLEAREYYDLYLRYKIDDASILNEYALFLYKNGFIKDAIQYFNRALVRYREKNNKLATASILFNLGGIYLSIDSEKADKYYTESSNVYKRIRKNKDHYKANEAMVLSHHAMSFKLSKKEKGIKKMNKALKIYRKLNYRHPKKYLSDVAFVHFNYGNLLSNYGEIEKAKENYYKSIEINRNLIQEDSVKYLNQIGITSFNLGQLFIDNQEFNLAEKIFEETLKIYKKLTISDPDRFSLQLASSAHLLSNIYQKSKKNNEQKELYNSLSELNFLIRKPYSEKDFSELTDTYIHLGNLYWNNNEYELAKNQFLEAEKYIEKLIKIEPNKNLFLMGKVKNDLGALYGLNKNYNKAISKLEEALKIYKSLAITNPSKYSVYVSDNLFNTAIFMKKLNRIKDAEIKYLESLDIIGKLGLDYPTTYGTKLLETYISIADFYFFYENYAKAKENYKNALRIFSFLDNIASKKHLNKKANILFNLGKLYSFEISELDQAQRKFYESLNIYKDLVKEGAKSYLPFVSRNLNYISFIHLNKGELNKADLILKEKISIDQELLKTNPKKYFQYLLETHLNIIKIYLNRDNPVIKPIISNLVEKFDQVEFEVSESSLIDMMDLLIKVGNTLLEEEDLISSEKYFTKALIIYSRFSENSRARYHYKKANALLGLGKIFKIKNEVNRAIRSFDKSLSIYEVLALKNEKAFLPYVSEILNYKSFLLFENKKFETAELLLEKKISIDERLFKIDSVKYFPYLHESFANITRIYIVKNEFSSIEPHLDYFVRKFESLEIKDQKKYLSLVVNALEWFGKISINNNDSGTAKKYANKARSLKDLLNDENK